MPKGVWEPASAKRLLEKQPFLGKAYNNTDSDVFSIGPTQGYIRRYRYLCGGGVEYLHRDPASRRRRGRGKSLI
jgi:hypothetical protein